MTRQEYTAKRAALLAEAKACIEESRVADFNAKKKEIEELDAKFETEADMEANFTALERSGSVVSGMQNMVQANGVVETSGTAADETETVYKNAFLKNLMGMRLTSEEQNAFDMRNAVTADNHSVLIPETMVRAIWTEMEELHPLLADAAAGRTYVRGKVSVPVADDENDAAWYDEDTETSETELTTRAVELDGFELSKCVTISWKMREMAVEEFEVFLRHKIAEKMSAAWAASYVIGKGVPAEGDSSFKAQPRGAVTALNAESGTPQIITPTGDGGHIAYADVTSAFGKIKSGYLNGAVVYAQNATIWGELANLCDENGRPLFIPDVSAGGVGKLFGRTVKEEESVPAGGVLIGNYARGYASNVNRDISVSTEDHGKKRRTDYIGYMIADGNVLSTKAFAYIKPGAAAAAVSEGGGE